MRWLAGRLIRDAGGSVSSARSVSKSSGCRAELLTWSAGTLYVSLPPQARGVRALRPAAPPGSLRKSRGRNGATYWTRTSPPVPLRIARRRPRTSRCAWNRLRARIPINCRPATAWAVAGLLRHRGVPNRWPPCRPATIAIRFSPARGIAYMKRKSGFAGNCTGFPGT